MTESSETVTLLAVGDVSPNRDDPPSIFRFCRDTFQRADLVWGQLEAPISDRGDPTFNPYNRGGCVLSSANASALGERGAGFDVMSFAGNHALDYGHDAFFDTIDVLKEYGIAVSGVGKDIHEARQAAILEKKGTKFGFLAYLSVLPLGYDADEQRPGCAPLWAWHAYRQFDWQVGSPPEIVSHLYPEFKQAMEEDVRALRSQVDVVVVSMHAGVHYVPAFVTMYQKEAAHAAIDAGADIVLQHHAHILQGIEFYKGKPIFYSLGNFALEHMQPASRRSNRRALDLAYRNTRAFYNVKPVPGYEKHHFSFDALKTLVAKFQVRDRKIYKVGFIPAYINKENEPELLPRNDPRATEVLEYMKHISDAVNFRTKFAWDDDGNEVLVSP
jgi:poly-gamma-glutamate synthesis protein (capsule biosynthesis protein)